MVMALGMMQSKCGVSGANQVTQMGVAGECSPPLLVEPPKKKKYLTNQPTNQPLTAHGAS